MLRQAGGCIVNISSVAGQRGGGLLGTAAYSTSKGAVIVLSKALAREFAAAKKVDQSVLLGNRIAPDILSMVRQAQIACDFAKGASARLVGLDVPASEDAETSFDEFKVRQLKGDGLVHFYSAISAK